MSRTKSSHKTKKVGRKPSKRTQQKINEFIPLLRKNPAGLTRQQIIRSLAISDAVFEKILYNTADYPVGYDARLDDNYYWVGR